MKIHLQVFGLHLYIANYRMKRRNYRQFDITKSRQRKRLRMKVLKERGGRCEMCGKELDKETMQVHHIMPLSMGGNPNNINNIMLLCDGCHRTLHGNPILYAEQIRKWQKMYE